jgi:hypothetical protein
VFIGCSTGLLAVLKMTYFGPNGSIFTDTIDIDGAKNILLKLFRIIASYFHFFHLEYFSVSLSQKYDDFMEVSLICFVSAFY